MILFFVSTRVEKKNMREKGEYRPEGEKLPLEEAMKEAYERKEKIEAFLEEGRVENAAEANRILDAIEMMKETLNALEKAKEPEEKKKLEESLDEMLIEKSKEILMETPDAGVSGLEPDWAKEDRDLLLGTIEKVAEKEMKKIAATDLNPKEKAKRLVCFVGFFASGARFARAELASGQPMESEHVIEDGLKEENYSKENMIDFFKGRFAASIMNSSYGSLKSLEYAAKLEGKDPHGSVKMHKEIIENMRIGLRHRKQLDETMRELGFTWNEPAEKYQSLPKQKSEKRRFFFRKKKK